MQNILNEIKIVFEDENILVLNKPKGLICHPDERTTEPSLSDFLQRKYIFLKDIGRPHTLDNERYFPRFGMLSRLDRATGGVILIAKNQEYFDFLQENKSFEKRYIATIFGNLENSIQNLLYKEKIFKCEDSFLINAPIGRNKKDPRKWTSKKNEIRNTFRDAETFFKILKSEENKTEILVFPKTGRTHQIRVHFDYLDFPILGDKLYGEMAEENKINNTEMFLIAKSIKFTCKNGDEKYFSID